MEDQSAIKGEFDQIGIRPIRVSHLGILGGEQKREGERKRRIREEKEEEEKKGMDLSL